MFNKIRLKNEHPKLKRVKHLLEAHADEATYGTLIKDMAIVKVKTTDSLTQAKL